MKYTNKRNLPEPIVRAIITINESYNRGEGVDYTVTELIKPPRMLALERLHDSEIEVDVADLIFLLIGHAVHIILERAGVPERRFAITVLGKTISGKMDRVHAGVLEDWKVTTCYRFKGGTVPMDIHAQLNLYMEILRQHQVSVQVLRAVGILRDWSKLELLRSGAFSDYPRHQVAVVEVPAWPREQAVGFLEARVRAHEAAKTELPDCTPGDRWAKPDFWAVKLKGREAALPGSARLPSRELAEAFVENYVQKVSTRKRKPEKPAAVRAKLSIEYRPGQNVRCESYCYAAPFCSQWKKLRDEQEAATAAATGRPRKLAAAPPLPAAALSLFGVGPAAAPSAKPALSLVKGRKE